MTTKTQGVEPFQVDAESYHVFTVSIGDMPNSRVQVKATTYGDGEYSFDLPSVDLSLDEFGAYIATLQEIHARFEKGGPNV